MCEQYRTLELCVSGMHNLLPHLSRMSPPGQLWPVLSQSRTSCVGDSQASDNDKARGFAGVLLHLWKPDLTDLFLGSYMHMGRQQACCRTQRLGGRVTVWGPPLQHRFGRSYFC